MTVRRSSSFPPYSANFRRDRPGNPNAGSCTLCRSSKSSADKPCVELGNNARPFREGMVVLCFNCAVEVGSAVGMLSAADRDELRSAIDRLESVIVRQADELAAFEALRGALDAVSGASRQG